MLFEFKVICTHGCQQVTEIVHFPVTEEFRLVYKQLEVME